MAASNASNMTLPRHDDDVQVALYGVVGLAIWMLASVFALMTNGALLACAFYKRTVRSLYYAPFFNICVANLVYILLWLPLHGAQMAQNYSGGVLPAVLCYADASLLHALLTALSTALVFLTAQRLCHMHNLAGSESVAAAGVFMPWTLAACAALAVGMHFKDTMVYTVCVNGSVHAVGLGAEHSQVAAVLATLYFIVLVSVLVLLLVLLLLQRQSLSQRLKTKYTGASEDYDPCSEAERLSLSGKRDSLRPNGEQRLHDSSSNFTPIPDTEAPEEEEEEEEEEDDDTFDMKMRERQRNSGRRHTVANISLADPNATRRGSLGNISDRSPTSLANKYQYVRKWSVDIVALQDQLENPTRLSPIPFQELHQKLKNIDQTPHEEEEELEKSDKDADDEVEVTFATEPQKKKKTVQLDHRIEEIDDLPSSPLASTPGDDVPSIVVNNACSSFAAVQQQERHPSKKSKKPVDSVQFNQLERELRRTSRVAFSLCLSIACIVPFTLTNILSANVIGKNLKFNQILISPMFMIVQALLNPLLFMWMDPRLSQTICRFRQQVSQWRCVCYCNVGKQKGRACFGSA